MARTVSWLLAGVAAGSAATAVVLHGFAPGDRAATALGPLEADAGAAPAEPIPSPQAFDQSLAALEKVAAETDGLALEAAAANAAREPRSARRDAELKALLARLAEIEPWRAVMLAQRLELGDEIMARLFKAWADADPDAALAELRVVESPYTKRAAALALLDVFGKNAAGIERVAAVFPPAEATNFRVDAIGKLAERDLKSALALASSRDLPQAVQSLAQQRVAQIAARTDPRAAFEQARSIAIPLFRSRYINSLMDTWATTDPDGAIAYIETAETPEISLGPAAFRALASSAPERLLLVAEKFAPATRTNAQAAALEALATLDPATAYRRASSLPTGDADMLIRNIADRYAEVDPNAALSWALSLQPRSLVALNRALMRVAAIDPLRATDVVVDEVLNPGPVAGTEVPSLVGLLAEPLRAASPQLVQVADRLAANSDPRVAMQLEQLLLQWPGTDPSRALDWALRNPEKLHGRIIEAFAQQISLADPALARNSLSRIPPDLQPEWVEGVAAGVARNDLEAAVEWIAPFSGQPLYERAINVALVNAAGTNPAAAAKLIAENPAERGQTASIVVASWAQTDAPAAEKWVLDLPPGTAQDRGLTALLQRSAEQGRVDARLLERMSTPDARQQAVLSAALVLALRDPDRGRRLIAEHITDAETRKLAEEQLESASRLAGMDINDLLGR